MILDNCIPLVVLGPNNIDKWWLPKSWKELHQATITFKNYMTNAYEEEKQSMAHGKKEKNNLMTSLVRASQAVTDSDALAAGKDRANPPQGPGGLTEQEIYGNIFVFNFAGHDTTANSLAFGLALIATRHDVQDWISEEINAVFGDQTPETSSYSTAFPRLKRCLAVMVCQEEIKCGVGY